MTRTKTGVASRRPAPPLRVDDTSPTLLADRVRTATWIAIVIQVVFAVADIWLNAELFVTLFLIKLAMTAVAVAVLVALRRAATRRTAIYGVLALSIGAS